MIFLLYLIIGALSGFLSGLLGIGGGIIVVPALLAAFTYANIPEPYAIHMAIGTSLAAMIVTTCSAFRSFAKRGSVRFDLVRQLLPGMMVGSIVGVLLAAYLSAQFLKILFAFFLLYVAFRLLTRFSPPVKPIPNQLILTSVAGFIGFLASILGAGGGTMLIPFLMRCQVTMLQATGTAVACGIGLGLIATINYMCIGLLAPAPVPWSTGYIYWPAFLGISLTSMVLAPLGVFFGHKLPTPVLKRVFGIFLLLIAFDMLYFSR